MGLVDEPDFSRVGPDDRGEGGDGDRLRLISGDPGRVRVGRRRRDVGSEMSRRGVRISSRRSRQKTAPDDGEKGDEDDDGYEEFFHDTISREAPVRASTTQNISVVIYVCSVQIVYASGEMYVPHTRAVP
jgi:hypothetical protein